VRCPFATAGGADRHGGPTCDQQDLATDHHGPTDVDLADHQYDQHIDDQHIDDHHVDNHHDDHHPAAPDH
jgi:hypothetical protein